MEAFLVSITTVAIAEMGDRTQLLSLVLAAHYRKPWPILAGVLLATLANHALAGIIGVWFGKFLSPALLDSVRGVIDQHPRTVNLAVDAFGGFAAVQFVLGDRGRDVSFARQCISARMMNTAPRTAKRQDAP